MATTKTTTTTTTTIKILKPLRKLKNSYSSIVFIDDEYARSILVRNANTMFAQDILPVVYNRQSDSNEILSLLAEQFTTIKRVAFVFSDSGITGTTTTTLSKIACFKTFMDNSQPFFTKNDIIQKTNLSPLFKWLIHILETYRVSNLDFLACNTLKNPNWRAYYNAIAQLCSNKKLIIGASENETGNLAINGEYADWIMENTGEDISNIYFNPSYLPLYRGSFKISIITESSVTFTIPDIEDDMNSPYTFPITILGQGVESNPTMIYFPTGTIHITNPHTYFICASDYLFFEGNATTIYVDNDAIANYGYLTSFEGLIQNGTGTDTTFNGDSFENIIVNNFTMDNNGGNIRTHPVGGNKMCAHITRRYFGMNKRDTVVVSSCVGLNDTLFATMSIIYATGCTCAVAPMFEGFVMLHSQNSVEIDQYVSAVDCVCTAPEIGEQHTGIDGIYLGTGGIFGCFAGFNHYQVGGYYSLYVRAHGCSWQPQPLSPGITGAGGGGIFGGCYVCNGRLSLSAQECFSTGLIAGDTAGGIFGAMKSSNVDITATFCYSTGEIAGTHASGIGGKHVDGGYLDVGNAYHNTIQIDQCYSTGYISGLFAGGIY